MNVVVVFMVSVSVEFINGVVVIVTSEIVLKLVEESLVSKLNDEVIRLSVIIFYIICKFQRHYKESNR